jgi:hypothetical protein
MPETYQQSEGAATGQTTEATASPVAPTPVPLIVPKNPAVATLISALFPGVGSAVNGDVSEGVAIFLGYLVSVFLMLFIIGFILAPAVWIFGMVHAYNGAKQWNLQHGIVS